MSELEQLKKRIIDSNYEGVPTAQIRDDYEPAGDLMVGQLTNDGGFATRRTQPPIGQQSEWRIWANEFKPY